MRRFGNVVIVVLCLCTAARVARAAQPAGVSLSLPDGRLALATVTDPRSPWVRYDDGRLARAEGAGPFDGGITLRDADGTLEIHARKNGDSAPAPGDLLELRLVQGRECALSLTIRAAAPEPPATAAPAAQAAGAVQAAAAAPAAPVSDPALTLTFREANLTHLVLRHPDARPYLDALLTAINPACRWRPDAFAVSQLDPPAYNPPSGVAERVASALAALRSEDWRQRRRACDSLRRADLALYCLLRLDRTALSPEQRRGVDEALAAFPVLTEADRRALRQITP